MFIKNQDKLSISKLRKQALEIIEAGFKAVDLTKIIPETIRIEQDFLYIKDKKFKLPKANLYLIGIGKGSFKIARELEKVLGSEISKGLVLDLDQGQLKFLESQIGTHPLPSIKNISATKDIINILKKAKKDDLVLFVVCGGGSALASAPAGLGINKLREINKKLIKSGAGIREINTIRKHLSLFKGGQAAKLAYPAQVVSLIVSDVPESDLGVISSGPTVRDRTTNKSAQKIAKKYGFLGLKFKETPKDKKYFKKVSNILFLSNKIALETMAERADKLGYKVKIYSFKIKGEAKKLAPKLLKTDFSGVILAGGESSVKVKGRGKGGRSQELVLAGLPYLKKNQLIVSIASDGWDNTEAAGAVGDKLVIKKAEKMNLNIEEYLSNNDSFHFFQKTNDLIYAKPGLNLADFVLVINTE